ncbi:MAG: hypothetical protein M1274_10630 [Actinobacteria bacterium]|nr:hypothetical protein [Actinomycetota bacterium]
MTIGPFEAQLLASSVLAVPAIAILLFAVCKGHFRHQEAAKYAVFTARDQEEDFWDRDWNERHGRAATAAKSRPRPVFRPEPREGRQAP